MAVFKYDPTKIGDNINQDELEKLKNDAIKYGEKLARIEAEEKEKSYNEQVASLQSQLNEIKNETILQQSLQSVEEKNIPIIKKLINNDPQKIEEIKKEYPNLFEKERVFPGLEKLTQLESVNKVKTIEEIKKDYLSGKTLDEQEKELMWNSLLEQEKGE